MIAKKTRVKPSRIQRGAVMAANSSTAVLTASAWMNAAFALDELHQTPEFRALAAEMDALEKQQPLVEPPDTETMDAFLTDMEQLSDEDEARRISFEREPSAHDKTTPSASSHAATCQAAAPEPKRKKKISSYERLRRHRDALLQVIGQMEEEIDRRRRDRPSQLSLILRWKPIVLREIHEKNTRGRAVAIEKARPP